MASSFLDEALARIRADGLLVDKPIADGKLHRCPTQEKPRSMNGAYAIHLDKFPMAWWQNWELGGLTGSYSEKNQTEMPTKERKEYKAWQAENKRKADELYKKALAAGIKGALALWNSAAVANDDFPYLKNKGVPAIGLGVTRNNVLLVPLYNSNGQLQAVQRIFWDAASGKFFKRFTGKSGGCYFKLPAKSDSSAALLIAEGYATGASGREATGLETWIAFNAGNLDKIGRLARQKYPAREICFLADYDVPTNDRVREQYPEPGGIGVAKARAAAMAIGGYLAICPSIDSGEIDFNDLHQRDGLSRVKDIIEKVLAGRPVTDCIIPDDFTMKPEGPEAGLYWKQPVQGGLTREVKIGDPLHILGYTRTGEGDNWGLLLAWKDKDGREHQYALSKSLLTGLRSEWLPLLADIGWTFESAYKKQIARYLEASTPIRRIRCVTTTGWSDDRYVLPDQIYGDDGDQIVLQATGYKDLYQSKGSLEEWQEMAALCVDNPKLGFAVSCAFAGPLLKLADMEGGIFNFEGGSSCGKTTALQAAASVWGKPEFHVKKWKTTDNALEVTASLHNDGLLILDELGEIKAKILGETVYMLSGGQGKNRAGKDGGLRKSYRWRVITLSSGELGLADKLMEDGRRSKAGQEARFVAIPVNRADIKELHGLADSGQLVRQIKKLADTHYGVAGRAFLERLTQGGTLQAAKTTLQGELEDIADSFCPKGCDGQVRRVALRFALVFIAGTLAREMGILPADFEAADYARICFREWLEQRGGTGPAEEMAILNQVRLFIEQHGQSRFQDWDNPDAICLNRVGLRKPDQDGNTIFYAFSEGFKEIVKGYNPIRAAQVLVDKGLLKRQAIGHYTNRVSLPRIGRQRVYVLQLPKDDE